MNALGGLVSFRSTVGNTAAPTGVLVNAMDTTFVNTVAVGANGLEINGFGGSTTLTLDITSDGAVTINDDVLLAGDVEIDTSSTPSNVFIGGTVDGAQPFEITSGAANVTLEDSIGSNTALTSLTITSGARPS